MLTTLCRWFLYFAVYSVLGWVCETVYCSIIQRKFVNRGFLKGPVCPVYGVGAVLVVLPAASILTLGYLAAVYLIVLGVESLVMAFVTL